MAAKELIDQVLGGKPSARVVRTVSESANRKKGRVDESVATMYHYYHQAQEKKQPWKK